VGPSQEGTSSLEGEGTHVYPVERIPLPWTHGAESRFVQGRGILIFGKRF